MFGDHCSKETPASWLCSMTKKAFTADTVKAVFATNTSRPGAAASAAGGTRNPFRRQPQEPWHGKAHHSSAPSPRPPSGIAQEGMRHLRCSRHVPSEERLHENVETPLPAAARAGVGSSRLLSHLSSGRCHPPQLASNGRARELSKAAYNRILAQMF